MLQHKLPAQSAYSPSSFKQKLPIPVIFQLITQLKHMAPSLTGRLVQLSAGSAHLTIAHLNIFVFVTLYLLLMKHLREKHPLLKTNKLACNAPGIFINL